MLDNSIFKKPQKCFQYYISKIIKKLKSIIPKKSKSIFSKKVRV